VTELVPRVAVLVDRLGGGGAQRSALMTASALQELGTPTMMLAALSGTYLEDVPEGVPVHLLAPSWPRLRAIGTFAWRLNRMTRVEDTDVVVTNGFGVSRIVLLARVVGLLRDVRVVVVEHSTLSVVLNERFRSRVVRAAVLVVSSWLYRRADAIVGVSEGVSRDLEATLKLPPGSVTTIYNPVDTDRIAAAINETVPGHLEAAFTELPRPMVITTGRLVAQKAHRDLLEAFNALPDAQRGSLVILGEGPLRGDLEQQAQSLGLADRAWMPGFVDNPWWFIARSDIFALSSHWEGHPLVLLEALCCGVPVVSTDCPHGPFEILDGVPNTRLTPVGDPDALADAIGELLTRPTEPISDASKGRSTPVQTAARYRGVVSEVAARRSGSQWSIGR
jgi:glycosyltransferase involved in cell wall biosynthesis